MSAAKIRPVAGVPRLYLGNIGARAEHVRVEHGIAHVVSLLAPHERTHVPPLASEWAFDLDDHTHAALAGVLRATRLLLDAWLRAPANDADVPRAVLVHCHRGISRSATVVIDYLMYRQHLDYAAALALLHQTVPDAAPHEGFAAQLSVLHGRT